MFNNYFKIAARQLRKQRMYSVIKFGGFAMSIAACLLIGLYIRDELSYDKQWTDANRIYRVTGEYRNDGKVLTGDDFPAPLAKALMDGYPEIEKAGRFMDGPLFYGAGSNQVKVAGTVENTFEAGFSYADQAMLDILQVPMLYGERAAALNEPNTIVISESKAEKYFPKQNPVGKTLILNDDETQPYKIGGVMKDIPTNSHLRYDFLLTLKGHELWPGEQTYWMASNYVTYILVKPGTDIQRLQTKLTGIIRDYYVPAMKANGEKEAENLVKKAKFLLQPISEVHLYSAGIDDGNEKGDIKFVWLFGAIAIFILVIACINFINLSTAKSANRAREVGLRKVIGSYRVDLIKQFLAESILLSVLSFALGLLIAVILLPYFNTLAAKSLTIPWTKWWLVPMMAGSSVLIGVVAGLYPSFYLSSFKPIQVLRGQISRGSKSSILRNGLVVFQFTTSIILIIGTIVIYKQTHYLLNRKVGFDKDQVMVIQGTNTLRDKRTAFKEELLRSPEIKSVSISDYLPIAGTKRDGNGFYKEGRKTEDQAVSAQKWVVDYDYLNTMGMHLREGRFFSKEMASDSAATVINKSLADKLGLTKPIGQTIVNGWQSFTVIGVMDDFNYESMRQDVAPLCLILGDYSSTMFSVKISGKDTKKAIAYASQAWKSFSPSQPFRYTFLDESFARMYADVQRTGRIFTSFAILAIVIACLGLFALSAFLAEQRHKEIGIRKVLGASVNGITAMLSKDFVKLVIISIVIAAPIAWWAMTKWLEDFAYKISISWWMIGAAGLTAILIALFTISFQSIKAALANPIKSLRTE